MAIKTADVIMPGNENAFETGRRGEISSIADLDESYRWLLEKNVTATLATVKRNGLPQLTPIWVAHDGVNILVNTKKGRLKDRNMRERADVAILCVNPANPYHWMAINGKVVEMIEETDPAKGREATDNVNELAQRYINTTPYPLRDPKGEVRVLFKVRPTYVMTFGPPPAS
jgi:PPOX class probable F420-dependent enzyme